LDLALEALESIPEEVEGYLPQSCTDAVIAIKQARSAPVQEPVGEIGWGGSVNWHKAIPEFGTDLYTTPPAQPAPVQEPESFEQWNAKQHADPEEIGFLQALRIAYCSGQDSVTKSTPPAAPVPLTDEQWEAIARAVYTEDKFTKEDEVWHNFYWLKKFKIAIEAAHGITKGKP
jgi:hypothetical protein